MYAEEAKKQLENSYDNSNALSEVAKHQQSEELQSLKSIKAFAKQIEKDIAKLNNAVILLSSPEDIAISTAQNMHLSANGQINQHAENSINISTQKSLIAHVAEKLSLFAAKLGVKIFAGKGKVEIQAQNDGMDLFARKLIEIISTEDAIEIKAKKKIILTGDTSQIEINGQGIFSRTKGPFEVKSGQHSFKGAEQVKIEYPHFYENICIPCLLAAAAQGLVFIDK